MGLTKIWAGKRRIRRKGILGQAPSSEADNELGYHSGRSDSSYLAAACSAVAGPWLAAPKEEAGTANPVAASEKSIAAGRKTYLQYCAMCHGPDARGNAALAASLGEEPSDLLKRQAEHSEGDMHWKIRTGRKAMPSYGEMLSDSQIWDLINYIKSLK